jgi:hypothetical protein
VAADFSSAVPEPLRDHGGRTGQGDRRRAAAYGARSDRGVELGLLIVEDVGARHYFPVVRMRMHTGAAVERGGDWFGAAVNLAASLWAVASGSEVLLTAATREAAGTLTGVELHGRRRRSFENVAELVEICRDLLRRPNRRRCTHRTRVPDGRRPRSQSRTARARRRRVPLLLTGRAPTHSRASRGAPGLRRSGHQKRRGVTLGWPPDHQSAMGSPRSWPGRQECRTAQGGFGLAGSELRCTRVAVTSAARGSHPRDCRYPSPTK